MLLALADREIKHTAKLCQDVGDIPVDSCISCSSYANSASSSVDVIANRGVGRHETGMTCVRMVATVLSTLEDLLASELPSLNRLVKPLISHFHPGDDEVMYELWRGAALELSDARTDEPLALAILLYILQILSVFVFDGGSSRSR